MSNGTISPYEKIATTYIAKEQSFAVVEIGDSKQPDTFYPQVKIMRWDNEVNFSVRLTNDEIAPTDALVADKIEWVGVRVEAKFYEIGEGKEGGGYEFELILKEPPNSNIISMTIQTKGLDFFYQPELTQEEIDRGVVRPENVVGSYAVYHKTMTGDYAALGGKNYKTGKAFHIYRPRIEDANGNWVWGELNIDETAGILTVTIPQDFLDKAVYPVIHAAGLTFGYTTHGSNYSQWSNANTDITGAYSPASNGDATRVTVYMGNWPGSTNTSITLGIFSWDGTNYAKLKDTGETFVTTTYDNPAEYYSDLDSSLAVLSANEYHLGFQTDQSIAWYSDTIGGITTRSHPNTYVPGTLESAPGPNFNEYTTEKYSIWATYTEAVAGLSIPLIGGGLVNNGILTQGSIIRC